MKFGSIRSFAVVGAIAFASLGVACSDDEGSEDATDTTATATATATAAAPREGTGTETATGTQTGDATQAPQGEDSLEAYSRLVEQVTAEFPDVTLIEDTGSFEVGGVAGDGRRVLVFGTAAELPSFVEIEQTLRGILEEDGWTEDTQLAADGPTGTMSVWRKGDDTAILGAGVSPQDPSACPADQVIGECLESLEPSEINVQGSIAVADR
jgi:hypothetical protein